MERDGVDWYWMGWNIMEWNGMGWDGMEWDGMGWDGRDELRDGLRDGLDKRSEQAADGQTNRRADGDERRGGRPGEKRVGEPVNELDRQRVRQRTEAPSKHSRQIYWTGKRDGQTDRHDGHWAHKIDERDGRMGETSGRDKATDGTTRRDACFE